MRNLVVAAILLLTGCAKTLPSVQEGDVIFQTSRSGQSLAIQKATHSPYSHMGIIIFRDGTPYVFETVATTRYTPLKQWINRGQHGRYVLKRLKDAGTILTPEVSQRLHDEANHYLGRPYDLMFEWSDDRMYCSELVWKLYKHAANMELGQLQTVKDLDLSEPVVKAKMHERYGDKVPLNETVISPAAMFDSPLLVVVSQT